jgi:hypothetical protein
MASDNLVRVPNVRAISDGLALICELPDKRRIGVPVTFIHLKSEVRRPGDYGALVIPRQLAQDLGLNGEAEPLS